MIGQHVYVKTGDNNIYHVGYNGNGQLCTKNSVNRYGFELSSYDPTLVKYIFPTSKNTFVVYTNNTLWGVGSNNYGQLGNSSSTTSAVTSLNRASSYKYGEIKQVDAGDTFSFVLTVDGDVYAAGYNSQGNLGIGNTTNKKAYVQSGITNVKKISCGMGHTLALKNDGTVWATGLNSRGQLGVGNTTNKTSFTQVSGITDAIDIAAGYYESIILRKDGTILTTGYNRYGELGLNDTTQRTTFTAVPGVNNVKSVYAGNYFLGVLKKDNSLWLSGKNYGQFNNGTANNSNVFIKTSENVKQVILGANFVGIVRADKKYYACGNNNGGQLATGTNSPTYSYTELESSTISDIDILYPLTELEEEVIKYLVKSLEKYYTINDSNILEETTSDLSKGISLDLIKDNINVLPDNFSLVTNNEKTIKYSGIKDELVIQENNFITPEYDKITEIISDYTTHTNDYIKFIFYVNDKWYTYFNSEFIEVTFEVEENPSNEDEWIRTKNDILSEGINIVDINKLASFLNEKNAKSIKFAFTIGTNIIDEIPSIKSVDMNYDNGNINIRLKKSEYNLVLNGKSSLSITPNIDIEQLNINIL